jgi:hypothetical protein
MSENEKHLENKVIILNGFSNDEIVNIMRVVKKEFETPGDLIFAKTTPNSIKMTLNELIEDVSEDHAYLKANPPQIPGKE